MNQTATPAPSQVIIKVPQQAVAAGTSSEGGVAGGAMVASASIVKTPQVGASGTPGQQLVVTQSKGTTVLQPTGAQGHGGAQHYILTVSTNNTPGVATATGTTAGATGDHVGSQYPTIQYVDGTGEQSIYTNGQQASMQYEYPGANIYTPVSSYQYHGQQGIAQLGSIQGLPAIQSQMVHQTGGHTYLIHGGAMDGEGHPLTHTTRASPATVRWITENFEACDGVSLPRAAMYGFYLHHCKNTNTEPTNQASFGKLVRALYKEIKTRRLGQRGNSKYHYYGIRIKGNSPLNQLVPDDTAVAMRQPATPAKRIVRSNLVGSGGGGEGGDSITKTEPGSSVGGEGGGQQGGSGHQQFLGLGRVQDIVPCLEMEFDETELPDGVTEDDTLTFENLYKEHCETIADVVVNLQFSSIERLWEVFWNSDASPSDQTSNKLVKRLPKETLYAMACWEPVQTFVRSTDCAFYQALIEVLIPDVLRPIPGTLTQAIRNFAKGLEGWLKSAMSEVPEEMVKIKLSTVASFSQTLRRYTSLNHLAQAARAVLQNGPQIEQMITDLNKVDFLNIQEQASWVCQCEEGLVSGLESDFKKTLQAQRELEDWAAWLEDVVTQALRPHREDPVTYPKAARQFLLKWSFYSSMIIRDLTLRSAASFGSFHLMRLLFDEYMFYLVEHRVANATKETPIAIMGDLKQLDDMNNTGLNLSEFFETKSGSGSLSGPVVPVSAPLDGPLPVSSQAVDSPTPAQVPTAVNTNAKTIVVVSATGVSPSGAGASLVTAAGSALPVDSPSAPTNLPAAKRMRTE